MPELADFLAATADHADQPPADPNANDEYQQARSAITRKREQ